jgi:hypothetical protein
VKLAAPGLLGLTENRVELRAYEQDELGNYTVDVGARGFLKPVKLRMSYGWSTLPILDPSVLRIVWQIDPETQEVYPTTLDPSGRTVSTQLNHFSDYILGTP